MQSQKQFHTIPPGAGAPCKKFLPYILLLSISFILYSCSGGDDESLIQRAKDSTSLYVHLDESFKLYKSALDYNDSKNDEMAKDKFEESLKRLKAISDDIIEAPGYFIWRKDYEELATSIVQDYLATQENIKQNSLVFQFAKRLSVKYQKEELKEVTGNFDREALPDGSGLELVRNSVVDEFIDFWTNTERGRNFIDKTVYRSGKYFPLLRKILRFHNAPEELVYLSVQESGLNPTIVSRSGAVGLWQFMPATGMAYGLYQDAYRDDRRDMEKSTDAAARHLLDLYRTYDDWYLAFAAYNAGPGRVNSAIRKGGIRDFWAIRGYLPGETKNYVPYILALSHVFRNLGDYGFSDVEYGDPISFERVNIKANISLQRVAEMCGSDIETIRDLNSELTTDMVPLYEPGYQLRIPFGTYDTFAANFKNANDFDKNGYDSPEYAGNEVFGKVEKVVGYTYKVDGYFVEDPKNIINTIGKNKITYTYKSKDRLNSIAINYSVRPTDIRIWNNISYGKLPLKNQQLTIYVPDKDYSVPPEGNDLKEENKNITEDKETLKETKTETPDVKREFFGEKVKSNSTNTKNTTKNTKTEEKTKTETKTESPPETKTKSPDMTVKSPTSTNTPNSTSNETKTKKETVTKKNTASKQTYSVKEGDYLGTIAEAFGVSVSDIKDWNGLNDDVIYVNQKLTIYSDTRIKNVSNSKTVPVTHKVAEGENLTLIANKYGTSIETIMEKNGLEDDVIMVGQNLIISGNSSTGTKKETKKTYTVQSGDILTKIAAENGVTIQQIMSWNGLTDDKILVGQVLKLYGEDTKSKTNTKTNTKPKKNRKRKN